MGMQPAAAAHRVPSMISSPLATKGGGQVAPAPAAQFYKAKLGEGTQSKPSAAAGAVIAADDDDDDDDHVALPPLLNDVTCSQTQRPIR